MPVEISVCINLNKGCFTDNDLTLAELMDTMFAMMGIEPAHMETMSNMDSTAMLNQMYYTLMAILPIMILIVFLANSLIVENQPQRRMICMLFTIRRIDGIIFCEGCDLMEHVVSARESGMRVRDVLRRVMGVSYSAMKSAKWDDRITVDGASVTVDTFVREGQTVAIRFKDAQPVYQVKPYYLPLTLPYEDEHLYVIDKIAPLASQASENHPDDALENALFAHLGCPENFIYRPVNRLDKGTSGLMIVAKDAHSQHRLQKLLHSDEFARTYLAVVEGHLPRKRGAVDAPIGKVDAASIKREVREDGKPSVTHYEVLQETSARSLVRLRLETGRTHQIRVHMAHLGCPVSGDFLYGTELPELPGRFALHSHELTLRHPLTLEELHIVSPLPSSLRDLLV